MRHLKFRAWDFTRKEFNHKILVGNTNPLQDNYTCPNIHDREKGWINADSDESVMVVEISQWTNFTDNDGMDIYEGDHITLEGVTRLVYWNETMGMWECSTVVDMIKEARVLSLSYCISVGYILTGHKWN